MVRNVLTPTSMVARLVVSALILVIALCWGCGANEEAAPDCVDGQCDVIGGDERRDWFDVSEKSQAGGVNKAWRAISEDSIVAVSRGPLVDPLLRGSPHWQTDAGLCADEKFANQPFASFCSGLLIADDLVLTAGHCVDGDLAVSDLVFLFNYRMENKNTLATIDLSTDVYRGVKAVDWELSGRHDYALIQLDRPATPFHKPHPWVRWNSNAEVDEHVVIISHPNGLPVKFSRGYVYDSETIKFEHTADTLGGSSGAAVFDRQGFLIGIHTQGLPSEGLAKVPGRDCEVVIGQELPAGFDIWIDDILNRNRANAAHHATRSLAGYCENERSVFCAGR